jgi:hypothetical protein
MHLSTTSNQSPAAISPSEGLNENTAKTLFSLLTSKFDEKQTHERFARLTNAFNKRLEKFQATVALHFALCPIGPPGMWDQHD